MNMRTMLYLASAYLVIVGVAEFVSNSSTNSPTFDTVAALPSVGSLVAKSGSTTMQAGLDVVGAVGMFIAARKV